MRRDLRRSIRKSLGRYLAIVAIIALGAGVLCGLRCTTSAMLKTGQDYMNRQNLFDLRVLNTYGFTGEAVDRLGPGARGSPVPKEASPSTRCCAMTRKRSRRSTG